MPSHPDDPLSPESIEKLRSAGYLRFDDRCLRHVETLLQRQRDAIAEPDPDAGWIAAQHRRLEAFNDDFFLLSESVESPIEQLLGVHFLFLSDGYNDVHPDFIGGEAFPDPEFGTYFRCQQEFGDYRLDFVFKLCFRGDHRLLAVECDGHDFHERTKEQAARDRARDRALLGAGIPVIRFTGSEIHRDPQGRADEVCVQGRSARSHGAERPRSRSS